MPKPGSCWAPRGDFGGQPAPVGVKAGTPLQGCGAGWREVRQPQCLPHHGTGEQEVLLQLRHSTLEAPRCLRAPSCSQHRSDSHNKGPMPKPAATLMASRAQLKVDMVQPPCTHACTSGPVLAEGACLGSGAGVWVARDGRWGELGLSWVNQSCPWAALAAGFLPSSRALVKIQGPTLGAVLAAPCETLARGRRRARLTLPTVVPSSGRKHPSFILTHPSRLLQIAPLPASPPASATPAAPPTRPATTASAASGSGRAFRGGYTAHRSCLQQRGRQSQCQRRQRARGTHHKLMPSLGHR